MRFQLSCSQRQCLHFVPTYSYLRLYHRAILGYITAFYPLFSIVLTWICNELHDRNFRMIVFLWRPFHRCFVRLRRGWDIKYDLINVFANFFLLSFTNISYRTVIILNNDVIFTYLLNSGYSDSNYVFDMDNTIGANSVKYIVGTITAAVLISLMLTIYHLSCSLFTSFARNLIPYPLGKFRRMLSKLRVDTLSIMPFMEKFHCSYTDSIDGKKDMILFSGSCIGRESL